eukprot:TRINITY_DN6572_c0_g1_i1.p1 TRINITY_DN6572_c0_g1~~TRINITY_DN6572_c0_g1_i1.p1  ORF type:complete len:322 (-),score=41.15 TRINITY_DN6572_c0_g1_i1:212-1060(-)
MTRALDEEEDRFHLQYCLFDWDDNVVHMPTKIWMESVSDGQSVGLSTREYAKRRSDPGLRHAETAFREFRDETGDFEKDLRHAMSGDGWKAPAFNAFKQTVMEGRLFAIITARGHSEQTLRRSVDGFIHTILSETEKQTMKRSLQRFNDRASEQVKDADLMGRYLDLCSFFGVTNPDFIERSGTPHVEEGKKHGIRTFVERMMEMSREVFSNKGTDVASISFGMSDDDRKNVDAVDNFMRDEMSVAYPGVKFKVFDTGVGGGKTRKLKSHRSDPDLYPVAVR